MVQKNKELDRYIKRVRQIPLLTREEEHELAKRVQAGDQKAADKLVESNLRYVVSVALKYRRYNIPLGDLLAEGNVGLVTAVRKFDPSRGTRFVTYAGYWIRAFILEAVVRSKSLVGPGTGPFRSKLFFRLRRERAQIASQVKDPKAQLEIMAERFETTPEKMEKMLHRLDSQEVSLDQQVFDDSSVPMVETIDSGNVALEEITHRRAQRDAVSAKLEDALDVLDQRERYIVENRILSDEGMTLAALGRDLGVSRERARQLEARAKGKLRAQLSEFAPAA